MPSGRERGEGEVSHRKSMSCCVSLNPGGPSSSGCSCTAEQGSHTGPRIGRRMGPQKHPRAVESRCKERTRDEE